MVFGMLDIALRFMPIEWVAFRAWEVVTDHPGRWAAFAALKTYRNPHAYGDLSNVGNLPALREYHEEIFTTDEYGFRNSPQKEDGRVPRVLLIGTSFSAGCGLSDDETLSAQLGARLKCRVYNAAGPWDYCNCARRAIARLKMHQGIVIYEFAERNYQPQDMLYCLDALHYGYDYPLKDVLAGALSDLLVMCRRHGLNVRLFGGKPGPNRCATIFPNRVWRSSGSRCTNCFKTAASCRTRWLIGRLQVGYCATETFCYSRRDNRVFSCINEIHGGLLLTAPGSQTRCDETILV